MKKDLNFCIQFICLIFFFHLSDITNRIYNLSSENSQDSHLLWKGRGKQIGNCETENLLN